jgi:hypothetical protein
MARSNARDSNQSRLKKISATAGPRMTPQLPKCALLHTLTLRNVRICNERAAALMKLHLSIQRLILSDSYIMEEAAEVCVEALK